MAIRGTQRATRAAAVVALGGLLLGALVIAPASTASDSRGFRSPTASERAGIGSDLSISKKNRQCLWIRVWARDGRWGEAGYGGSGTPGGINRCPPTDTYMILQKSRGSWGVYFSGTSGVPCSLAKGLPKGFWTLPCQPDPPKTPPVSLSGPSVVTQGDSLTVTARTKFKGVCTFNFLPEAPIDPQGLTDARVVSGQATATVGTRGWAVGKWRAWVRCGSSTDDYMLRVKERAPEPPLAADVRVVRSGWSWRAGYSGSYSGSTGILLRNESSVMDAQYVSGIVNVTDADGRLVETASWDVSPIGASQDFWLAVEWWADGRPPFDVDVVVKKFDSARQAARPVPVTTQQVDPCDADDAYRTPVTIVVNRLGVSQIASGRVHLVAVSSTGQILGGTRTSFRDLIVGVPEKLWADDIIANCSKASTLFASIDDY